jgi:hypothetical protein
MGLDDLVSMACDEGRSADVPLRGRDRGNTFIGYNVTVVVLSARFPAVSHDCMWRGREGRWGSEERTQMGCSLLYEPDWAWQNEGACLCPGIRGSHCVVGPPFYFVRKALLVPRRQLPWKLLGQDLGLTSDRVTAGRIHFPTIDCWRASSHSWRKHYR